MEKTTQEIICMFATGLAVYYTTSTYSLSILSENATIPYRESHVSYNIDVENIYNYIKNIDLYNNMIEDGIRRYKIVNKTEYRMMNKCYDFLKMLFDNFPFTDFLLSFRNDSVKAVIKLNEKTFSLKHVFDCSNSLFMSTFTNKGDNEVLEVFESEIQDYNSIRNFVYA